MHTIILIALMMAMAHTQTLDSCTEYCEFMKSNQLRLFWRPDCDCSLDYQSINYGKNYQTKSKGHPSIENSEIYYEPSDEYPYQRKSFVDHPFYIVNPTYHKKKFKNTENRRVRKTEISNHQEELNNSIKKQQPHESAARTTDIDAKDSPLYLDIDIYKSIKNGRNNNVQLNKLKKNELTEDNLIECIDLHILVYSKQNDLDAATDFKDMWDETKINKYKALSESDLMIEIQSKCHNPTKIVYESLQEIKNLWPRKSELRSTQDIGTNPKNDSKEKEITEIIVTDEDSLPTTETVLNREEGTEIPLSTENPTEMFSLLSTTNRNNVIDYTMFASNFDSSDLVSEDDLNIDVTTKNNFSKKSFGETTTKIIKFDSNTSGIDNILTNNSKHSEREIDLQRDSLLQYSNDVFTATLESTTMVNTNFEFQTKNKTETHFFQTENPHLIANNTTSKPLGNNHVEIIENDLKIPRIFTKEFENSTVVSSIIGNELIPNNDFVENPIMKPDLTNNFLHETLFTKITTTETVTFNDDDNPFTKPIHATNQIEIIKASKDLKTNNNEKELSYLNADNKSSKFIVTNINDIKPVAEDSSHKDSSNHNLSTNDTKSTSQVPKNSNALYNENKIKDKMYSTSQDGSAELKSSNVAQSRPDVIPVSALGNNSGIIERNDIHYFPSEDLPPVLQSLDNYVANRQISQEPYLGRQNKSSDLELFEDSANYTSQITAVEARNLPNQNLSSLLLKSHNLTNDTNNKIIDETSNLKNNLHNTRENRSETNNDSVTKDIMNNLKSANISTITLNQTQSADQDTSLDFRSLNNSNQNKILIQQRDISNVTSHDCLSESFLDSLMKNNLNYENDTKSSTIRGKTPELFNNRTQKTEHSTNYEVRLESEPVTSIKTTKIYPIEEINSSMTQDLSQLSGDMDYSTTTSEKKDEVTRYYSSEGVPSEFLSYTSIPNTVQTEYTSPGNLPDISEPFNFKSENVIQDTTWYSYTTNEPPDLDTLNSSNTKSVKEVVIGSPSKNIVGKLFFLFGDQQVPVRFLQNSDGQINLGLDGETLCNKIIKNSNNDNLIIKVLCNSFSV